MKTKRILSILISAAMIFSMATFVYADELAAISADTIKEANIVDKAGVVTEPFTENSVEATAEGDTITVKIATSDLKVHENGNGANGYWTGFSVVAPENATQFKYAFGTSVDITIGEDLYSIEIVDDENHGGVAFYTNAGSATPKTYAKLQWYDESDNPVSAPTTFVMDLSNVSLDYGIDYTFEPIPAIIADGVNPETGELYDENSYKVTEKDGVVSITIAELKEHFNGAPEPQKGYWTGFALVAPESATKMRYAFSTDKNAELGVLCGLEDNVDGEGSKGIAFYVDAVYANKKYAKVQWYDEADLALSDVTEYEINIDNVTLYGLDYIAVDDVAATKVVDQANTTVQPYGSYNVTATAGENNVVNVKIDMTALKPHTNGEGKIGYWTGFAVVAPEGVNGMKYGFATDMESLSLGSECVLENAVAEIDAVDKDGIAFYSDVESNPKKYAMLQWFKDGKAVSDPTVFEIDFTDVAKYQSTRFSTGGGGVSSYTVKLDTNGGNELKNLNIQKGQAIGTIPAPVKKGFVFDGWYSDKELTKAYSGEEKVTEATTLYAGWKVDPVRQLTLTIGDKNATVFGEEKANDVAPIIRNDRTMLPIRFIAEALGADVIWDSATKIVTITNDDITIEITIDDGVAIVNGEEIALDSPAFIESDRTFLPLRFVSENLGAEVDWVEETKQVVITKPIEE